MRPLFEQDHYEILELPRDATTEEIERAFRLAQATYADDSLAGYSVFGDGEAAAIRERIETAYRVLSQPDARSAYDAALSGVAAPAAGVDEQVREIELPDLPDLSERGALHPESKAPRPIDELEALEDESGEFDGARLRRLRLHRGMEIAEISGITKISPTYLNFIEEDRYAELPAPVYVRGFVTAYADCIGLEAKRVAASYMRKFEMETGQSRRGRFLTGR